MYYYLGGPKTAKVGKLLEEFTPKNTRQGAYGWSTDMKFPAPISIYTILGVNPTQEVAVKLSNDGIYDVVIAHQ